MDNARATPSSTGNATACALWALTSVIINYCLPVGGVCKGLVVPPLAATVGRLSSAFVPSGAPVRLPWMLVRCLRWCRRLTHINAADPTNWNPPSVGTNLHHRS